MRFCELEYLLRRWELAIRASSVICMRPLVANTSAEKVLPRCLFSAAWSAGKVDLSI